MRIALVTQDEPFILPPALDTLCAARRNDIVALVILPAFNESLKATASRFYNFYGPYDFLRLLSRYVWAKIANKLNRLITLTRPYSATDVALRHSIPIFRPGNINAPGFVTTLREVIRPDLLVSVAASQIFKQQVLEVPTLGCINLHSAPLPRYQGMMPNFWVLVNGEPEATVTVHYMVEKLDAGNIIVQMPVPINSADSLHNLMVRSKRVGIQALLEALERIEKGTIKPSPMDPKKATYFSFPKREDAQRLRKMGHSLL